MDVATNITWNHDRMRRERSLEIFSGVAGVEGKRVMCREDTHNLIFDFKYWQWEESIICPALSFFPRIKNWIFDNFWSSVYNTILSKINNYHLSFPPPPIQYMIWMQLWNLRAALPLVLHYPKHLTSMQSEAVIVATPKRSPWRRRLFKQSPNKRSPKAHC